MKPLKYCNESLKQFCLENGVELCRDYSNELVRRETIIEGKCTAEGCDKVFKNRFLELYLKKSGYCKQCTYDSAKIKRQQTCLETYGVDNPSKSKEIKDKKIETSFKNYGVDNPSQNEEIKIKKKKTCFKNYGVVHQSKSEEIKIKKKETCLKIYGVDHQSKCEEIKDKKIETCFKNYGVNHPFQSEEIKDKIIKTCFKKYGVKNPLQNETIKNKIKVTNLLKYGVEYALQNKEVRNKFKQTCLKKFGVEHPLQNSIIMDKVVKSSYSKKDYIFPSGKCVLIQGYEHFALDELLQNENLDEEKILVGCKNVPVIWYETNDCKKHRYYVDIFIPSQNLCIEVKSDWTYNIKSNNVELKQQAAKEFGYNYEIWIYDKNGIKTNCYQ